MSTVEAGKLVQDNHDDPLIKPDKFDQGDNYKAVHCGSFAELSQYELKHPRFGVVKPGKVFLQELVGSTGMEVSINTMPPGKTLPFSHAHKTNEEMFIFIKGKGEMAVDGEIIPVEEGTCVRLAPKAVRCTRNNGSENLCFIVIQAKENSLGQHTFDDGIEATQELNWTK
jgi:mannose-6-phosphate isomerase-like protein (cupin superfamily)